MNILRHPATARAVPFGIYIAFLPLGQALEAWYPTADLRWLYGLQVGLVALALALFWRRYGELHVRAALHVGDVVLATATGGLIFVLWINLDQPIFTLGEPGAGYDPRHSDGRVIPALAMLRIMGAALVVPIMEELFWRSFLARWIDRASFLEHPPQRLSLKAMAASSILFGLEHSLWFAGVLAGAVYGWVYRRSGNLWVPVISHMMTNALLAAWVMHTGSWHFW